MNKDAFIITNVNKNQIRKDLPRTIIAFSEFAKKHSNAYLYLHCSMVASYGNDLAEFIKRYVPEDIGNNRIIFVDPYKRRLLSEDMAKIYAASDVLISTTTGEGWGNCVDPKTLIKTESGVKEIQNVIPYQDKVLTSAGYKHIIAKISQDYKGKIIKLTVLGRSREDSLKLTPEHEVLTKNGWVEAQNLKKDDILYSPSDVYNKCKHNYKRYIFDLATYCNDLKFCRSEKYVWYYGSKRKNYLRHIILNKKFAELYGIYLAEGSKDKGGIVFSISQDEKELTEKIIYLIKKVFTNNTIVRIENAKLSKKRWIRVRGKIFNIFFEEICGRGARNKFIGIYPYLTKHTASKVIKGFWMGDGSKEPSGYELTTCSRKLAYDLAGLAQKLNFRLSVEHNLKRDSYRLRTSINSAYKFSILLNDKVGMSKFIKYGIKPFSEELIIKDIIEENYNGLVWDICIKNAHEFMTHQCLIHNSILCKTKFKHNPFSKILTS